MSVPSDAHPGVSAHSEAPFFCSYDGVRFRATALECWQYASRNDVGVNDRLVAASGLVRAMVDSKIATQGVRPHTANIQAASDAMVAIAAGSYPSLPFEPDQDSRVGGWLDSRTLEATFRTSPRLAAGLIDRDKETENLLLISLAHGGTMAGALVRAELMSTHEDTGSLLYPVRLSMSKLTDGSMRVSNEESEYLTELARERQIVIVDEDVYTGDTMGQAVSFFSNRHFSRGRRVNWVALSHGSRLTPVTRAGFASGAVSYKSAL